MDRGKFQELLYLIEAISLIDFEWALWYDM